MGVRCRRHRGGGDLLRWGGGEAPDNQERVPAAKLRRAKRSPPEIGTISDGGTREERGGATKRWSSGLGDAPPPSLDL